MLIHSSSIHCASRGQLETSSQITLIDIEVPSHRNKLYPFPMAAEQALAKKYLDLLPLHVYSSGRMGTNLYFDIGDIFERFFELQEKIGSLTSQSKLVL
jgi:hypothetical protein